MQKMWKRAVALFALSWMVAAPMPLAAAEAPFMELPFPQSVETGNKIEVREFFWYGCPHCYTLEPYLKAWLKNPPANVEFIRTPGTAPHWIEHAKAYYALESIDAVGKVHDALFTAIQTERQKYNDEASLTEFVASKGVDAKRFREAYRSFGVRNKVERAKQMSSGYMVSSVPTLVVDGKYQTSPSMAGGEAQAIAILNQLIERARRERATGKQR